VVVGGRVARIPDEQVAIGGNDMYTSLCRKHFMRGEARMPIDLSGRKAA
jgi:thymidine kinase